MDIIIVVVAAVTVVWAGKEREHCLVRTYVCMHLATREEFPEESTRLWSFEACFISSPLGNSPLRPLCTSVHPSSCSKGRKEGRKDFAIRVRLFSVQFYLLPARGRKEGKKNFDFPERKKDEG